MFSYAPHFFPSSIILIGAGGTGSRLMPPMVQLVRTCIRKFNPQAWLEHLPIFVIDGDKVEEKNLLRQNFISKDVGLPKASVVATRYSNAFGIPIYSSVGYVNASSYLPSFLNMPATQGFDFNNSVIILAVDSAKARRDILNAIFSNYETDRTFFIDAGNEDSFGQVKFFTGDTITRGGEGPPALRSRLPKSFLTPFKMNHIPMDWSYYANLGGSAAEASCADLPQTLAINNMMASMICSVLQNFLYMKPMNYDGLRFSMEGSLSTEWNIPRRWVDRSLYNGYDGFYGGIASSPPFRSKWPESSEILRRVVRRERAVRDIVKGYSVSATPVEREDISYPTYTRAVAHGEEEVGKIGMRINSVDGEFIPLNLPPVVKNPSKTVEKELALTDEQIKAITHPMDDYSFQSSVPPISSARTRIRTGGRIPAAERTNLGNLAINEPVTILVPPLEEIPRDIPTTIPELERL